MSSTAALALLSTLETALARTEGQRVALASRRDALVREIELAKGRLELKGQVETFIESVHARTSRRNLQAFETLLTALVQEVLPGEKPVALELSTERGLAALDICVRRPDGTLEDVLEDNGGALTNVIGMALRLVAVVKAGAGRFLALDEADCWIAPERVSAFYRVLEDGAARLGIQCLAVSHHDLSSFPAAVRVSHVAGAPADGTRIVSPDDTDAWDAAQPGLRFIRLVNVQAFADATLHLSPGVNALVGPNNRGKSAVIRALRAVFYGEGRDSLVRAGARSALVEIGLARGRMLRFTRQPRRSPVNVWSLHEADGGVVEENGFRHETGGRAVPEWVSALTGIAKIEDLDVQIAHQKFPVFLLGEPPSRRSTVLSIGQEAAYLREMMAVHKERCARDMATIRHGERELAEADRTLERLRGVDAIRTRLEDARQHAEAIERDMLALVRNAAAATRLKELARRAEAATSLAAVMVDLPAPERLAALEEMVRGTRERVAAGERHLALARAARAAAQRHAALSGLPETLPLVEDMRPMTDTARQLSSLDTGLARAKIRMDEAQAGLDGVRAEMDRLVAELGGQCPTCGGSLDADALFAHHPHLPSTAAA